MKKILVFGAALVLGVSSFGFARIPQRVSADPGYVGAQTIMAKYIGDGGQYTKKTTIYIKGENVDANYFHAGHTVLQRTTYYSNGALLMGDLNGGFETINSGYANNGVNMDHFSSTQGLAGLTDSTKRSVDYTVSNKQMSDYFFGLSELIADYDNSKWVKTNDKEEYTYTIDSLAVDANGNYVDSVLKEYQYFAAPMLLQNLDANHYLSPRTIVIEDVEGTLSIRIYAPSDTGKLYSEGGLLAEARVYKGLHLPGYYLIGDFSNWEINDANKLGASDGNIGGVSSKYFSANGNIKVIEIGQNGYPYWCGNPEDNGNVAVVKGVYDIFLNNSRKLYADRVSDGNTSDSNNSISFSIDVSLFSWASPQEFYIHAWKDGNVSIHSWKSNEEKMSLSGTTATYTLQYTGSLDGIIFFFYQNSVEKKTQDLNKVFVSGETYNVSFTDDSGLWAADGIIAADHVVFA